MGGSDTAVGPPYSGWKIRWRDKDRSAKQQIKIPPNLYNQSFFHIFAPVFVDLYHYTKVLTVKELDGVCLVIL